MLHPGTSDFGAFKRLPLKKWSELWHLFSAKHPQYDLYLSIGPGEQWMAEDLIKDIPQAKILQAKGFSQLMGCMSAFDMVWAPDTGPMHLAAISGIPTFAYLGPSTADLNIPYPMAKNSFFGSMTTCSPCRDRRCKEQYCHQMVSPIILLDHIQQLI